MAEFSNSETLEGEEKKFEDMTDQEKTEWASNFLKEKGYSVVDGGNPDKGKEDAMKRAGTGSTRKPGSHKS